MLMTNWASYFLLGSQYKELYFIFVLLISNHILNIFSENIFLCLNTSYQISQCLMFALGVVDLLFCLSREIARA